MLGFAPVASFPVASDPMGTVYAVNLSEAGQLTDRITASAIFASAIVETNNTIDIIKGSVIGPPTPVPSLVARGKILVVDPRFLTVERWTALTAQALLGFGEVPRMANEDTWKQWAQYVRGLPGLAPLQIPDPRLYKNWRDWAFLFVHCVYVGTW